MSSIWQRVFCKINSLKNQIDYAIKQYTNINLDNDVNIILEEKRKTILLVGIVQ